MRNHSFIFKLIYTMHTRRFWTNLFKKTTFMRPVCSDSSTSNACMSRYFCPCVASLCSATSSLKTSSPPNDKIWTRREFTSFHYTYQVSKSVRETPV